MTTTDNSFEPIECPMRCGGCGERPKIRKYAGAEVYRLTCGCGGFAGIPYTTLDWLKTEFLPPFRSTGVPAPVRKPPEVTA